jgi:hypothetical protein
VLDVADDFVDDELDFVEDELDFVDVVVGSAVWEEALGDEEEADAEPV